MSMRMRLTRMLLWVSVFAWGTLLGSKLFDLRVLAGAWSASPAESLSLMPYGSHYPVDTGQYFFPFWPHNHALWAVATGAPDALRDRTQIITMARQWVTYDWLRVAMRVVGLVSAIRAISVPFPTPAPAQGGPDRSWRERPGT
jgi:hypothetical protein